MKPSVTFKEHFKTAYATVTGTQFNKTLETRLK